MGSNLRRCEEQQSCRPQGPMPSRSLVVSRGSDLAHLDPGVELAGQVAHEIAEVHPLLGVEEHGNAAARGLDLHVHDLHGEGAPARQPLAGLHPLDLPGPPLAPLRHLARGGPTDHPAIGPVALERRHRPLGSPHLPHRAAAARLHHHEVADLQRDVGGQVILGGQRLAQPYAYQISG